MWMDLKNHNSISIEFFTYMLISIETLSNKEMSEKIKLDPIGRNYAEQISAKLRLDRKRFYITLFWP